jgi:hypothetical protein
VEDTEQLQQQKHFNICEFFPLETKVTFCQNGNKLKKWSLRSSAFGWPPSPITETSRTGISGPEPTPEHHSFLLQDLAVRKTLVARQNSSDSLPRCYHF